MKLLHNLYFIVTFIGVGVTPISSQQDEKKNTGHEYMIQINDEWVDVIKRESPRFGFVYKRKLISNVHLFEKITPTSGPKHGQNELSNDMKDFKEFFAEKIIYVEKRERAIVKYYPLQNKTHSPRQSGFGHWILQTRTNLTTKKCWPYYGMGVQEAWSLGYTGFNIRVAVVDTGVEIDHPDLKRNADKDLSYNFVDSNHSNVWPHRFPNYWETEEITSHGTMAAGLISGEFGNDVCSAGIAFDATLVALKVFKEKGKADVWIRRGFPFEVDKIYEALSYRKDAIDIYSCSFNLHKKFKTASIDTRTALKEGVEQGRNGKGSIFVFSSGNNQGPVYDCNMEALANSIYTVTISSVGTNGSKPSYGIPCACTLASTYGEFKTHSGSEKLETTTHDKRCTDFAGTSASAALASGIIALTLQANPDLTWRDLQHIIIITSSFDGIQNTGHRSQNAVGRLYDHYFGFGLINATAMIRLAKSWKTVPVQNRRATSEIYSQRFDDTTTVNLRFDNCSQEERCVRYVEHVMINIKYRTTKEPLLEIILCSPSKTCSYLLNRWSTQNAVRRSSVHRDWNFTSVHYWGENPVGHWILLFRETKHVESSLRDKHLKFLSAELAIFGTSSKPYVVEYNVSMQEQPKYPKTVNSTKWFDKIVNEILEELSEKSDMILKDLSETRDKILTDLSKTTADSNTDSVDETSSGLTFYWVGILMAVVVTLNLLAAVYSFRTNIWEWIKKNICRMRY